ncbi:hypothetical protein E2986_04863 [Frieseomelitta varia]|uniref:Ig-like domain-containing protein n=1 Tax=Frieseomelitta varia TaxID=561572 RepID=A0A833RSN6_9HYME|nr:hypothetical protein E2986_04863 [Frieseomelitta varia]
MTTPIYSKTSESVQLKVIVPQTEDPKITFKKREYMVGESLEANCTSSAAHPVPHLTWYINGKEVDISLVNHYPHTRHEHQLMSATAQLTIKVSELHIGENGYLEISCYSTIPDYPLHHVQYADDRRESVTGNYLLFLDLFLRQFSFPFLLFFLFSLQPFHPSSFTFHHTIYLFVS